jgi:hypothetical protein
MTNNPLLLHIQKASIGRPEKHALQENDCLGHQEKQADDNERLSQQVSSAMLFKVAVAAVQAAAAAAVATAVAAAAPDWYSLL